MFRGNKKVKKWYGAPLLVAAFALVISASIAYAEYGDVTINNFSEQNGMRPVVFPHWFHRIRFRCSVCHDQLNFIMKKEANMIDMGKIAEGKFCGACHNGKISWAPVYCDRCHTGIPKDSRNIHGFEKINLSLLKGHKK